jgi:hypothetical protein
MSPICTNTSCPSYTHWFHHDNNMCWVKSEIHFIQPFFKTSVYENSVMTEQPWVSRGIILVFFPWHYSPRWALSSSILRHTVGLPWTSDHQSQRPLPTQNRIHNHKRQTSMPRAGFKSAIPATKRPKAYSLDRAATGISTHGFCS